MPTALLTLLVAGPLFLELLLKLLNLRCLQQTDFVTLLLPDLGLPLLTLLLGPLLTMVVALLPWCLLAQLLTELVPVLLTLLVPLLLMLSVPALLTIVLTQLLTLLALVLLTLRVPVLLTLAVPQLLTLSVLALLTLLVLQLLTFLRPALLTFVVLRLRPDICGMPLMILTSLARRSCPTTHALPLAGLPIDQQLLLRDFAPVLLLLGLGGLARRTRCRATSRSLAARRPPRSPCPSTSPSRCRSPPTSTRPAPRTRCPRPTPRRLGYLRLLLPLGAGSMGSGSRRRLLARRRRRASPSCRGCPGPVTATLAARVTARCECLMDVSAISFGLIAGAPRGLAPVGALRSAAQDVITVLDQRLLLATRVRIARKRSRCCLGPCALGLSPASVRRPGLLPLRWAFMTSASISGTLACRSMTPRPLSCSSRISGLTRSDRGLCLTLLL